MGIAVSCDGCGNFITAAITSFGLVKQKEYCDKCAASVKEFLELQDQLHTDIAAEFQTKRDALIDTWLKDHPTGSLPDE